MPLEFIPLIPLAILFGVYVLVEVLRYAYQEFVAYTPPQEPMELQDLIRDINPTPTPFSKLMEKREKPERIIL